MGLGGGRRRTGKQGQEETQEGVRAQSSTNARPGTTKPHSTSAPKPTVCEQRPLQHHGLPRLRFLLPGPIFLHEPPTPPRASTASRPFQLRTQPTPAAPRFLHRTGQRRVSHPVIHGPQQLLFPAPTPPTQQLPKHHNPLPPAAKPHSFSTRRRIRRHDSPTTTHNPLRFSRTRNPTKRWWLQFYPHAGASRPASSTKTQRPSPYVAHRAHGEGATRAEGHAGADSGGGSEAGD